LFDGQARSVSKALFTSLRGDYGCKRSKPAHEYAGNECECCRGLFFKVSMQCFLYPLFGIAVPLKEALFVSIVIVLIAFAKNFAERRVFNTLI